MARISGAFGQRMSKGTANYLSSGSMDRNKSSSKNSNREIPSPSQRSLIVTIPGFLLSPLMMLLSVDGGTADRFASALYHTLYIFLQDLWLLKDVLLQNYQ